MGSDEEEGDKGKKKKTKKIKEKYVDQEELNKTKLHMPHQCALMGEGTDEDEVTAEEPRQLPLMKSPLWRERKTHPVWKRWTKVGANLVSPARPLPHLTAGKGADPPPPCCC